jgi:hypothetical protein
MKKTGKTKKFSNGGMSQIGNRMSELLDRQSKNGGLADKMNNSAIQAAMQFAQRNPSAIMGGTSEAPTNLPKRQRVAPRESVQMSRLPMTIDNSSRQDQSMPMNQSMPAPRSLSKAAIDDVDSGVVENMVGGPRLARGMKSKFEEMANSGVMRRPRLPIEMKRAVMGGDSVMYKKGGSVSASKRGDGIAQRGKTKGRMI